MNTPYDAVILAGGEARRLGGADKALLDVGGRPLLAVVLAAVTAAARVVVVGPRRRTARHVTWCREDPPGGGPVAAIAAALPHTASPYLAVLATDLPFLTAATVDRLAGAARGHEGALLVDEHGHDQLLCAVYARVALVRRLGDQPAAGRSFRSVVEDLDLVRLPDEQGSAFDCDTWDDLARARRVQRNGRRQTVLDEWTARLKRELGLVGDSDLDVDVRAVLDLARVAAHQVDRPAAPLTTFLVGYAAGLRGGGADAVRDLAAVATSLAEARPTSS